MLAGAVLDRVGSINDLGVIMDVKINFSEHMDAIVGKAFAMLGFIRRLPSEASQRNTKSFDKECHFMTSKSDREMVTITKTEM
jgi:hypothetical protein